jgi:hypothetical protein
MKKKSWDEIWEMKIGRANKIDQDIDLTELNSLF